MEVSISRRLSLFIQGLLTCLQSTATITLALAVAAEQNYLMLTGDYNEFVASYGYIGNFVQGVSVLDLIPTSYLNLRPSHSVFCFSEGLTIPGF